jgi:ACT domain-containing protein
MKFVGNTTNGAASGETVFRRRRIHNLRQKDRRVTMIGYSICLLRLENSNLFYFYRKIYIGAVVMETKRAVVSVVGKDQIGIISHVTSVLADNKVNILDISQTILQDFFTMMMIVDVTNISSLEDLQAQLDEVGKKLALTIHVQMEEIFRSMHRI